MVKVSAVGGGNGAPDYDRLAEAVAEHRAEVTTKIEEYREAVRQLEDLVRELGMGEMKTP